MKKRIMYTELAYVMGILTLAFGTALMERADFGMSMVVAPAYLLHLKMSEFFPFFSFGMAEYVFQGALLLLMCTILRRFRLSYLLSFATAVIYGFALDGMMWVVSRLPDDLMTQRVAWYLLGMLFCSLGVSLLFHSYISPEVYELWVKEMSARRKMEIHRYKTLYDCASCLLGVLLSFAFFGFGRFEGVKLGTIFCALVNGSIIGLCSRLMEGRWEFRDRFALRRFFEQR